MKKDIKSVSKDECQSGRTVRRGWGREIEKDKADNWFHVGNKYALKTEGIGECTDGRTAT